MTAAAGFGPGLVGPVALARKERAARSRHFTPPPILSVSEWADRYRMLSRESSAAPGKWVTDRAPYLRGIMDAIGDDRIERVVFIKPTQVGGTETLLNALGYYAAEDPCPILCVQPTVDMAKAFVRERIEPMLRDTPRLASLVRKSGGRRTSDDTLGRKVFPGGYVAFIGSNSPSALRSRPVRVLLADELSAWPESAGDEGDPLELAERRMATFWNRMLVATSTPTVDGFCAITRLWHESDRRRYHVACPHCGERQPLRWRDADDAILLGADTADAGQYRLVFERDATGDVVPESVHYVCAICAALIDESAKGAMLAGGAWVAHTPGRRTAGFHLNALYSPWVTWAEVAARFLKAKGTPELLKTFVNTFAGLPWQDAGERLEPHTLMARAEPLGGVPDGAAGTTVGIDVQGDRVELLRVAWGAREEAWILEWRQVHGDPAALSTWAEVTAVLSGWAGDPLLAVGVDSGFQPEAVWRWADGLPPALRRRVFVLKGMPGRGRVLMTAPGAATKKRQRRPWLAGVDSAKDLLAQRLRAAAPGPGAMHFSEDLDPAFFDQLTAEQVVTVYRAGRPAREWRLIPGRRNEALDLTVYALASLYALGPRVVGALAALATQQDARRAAHRRAGAADERDDAPRERDSATPSEAERTEDALRPVTRPQKPAPFTLPRRGGWVNGWK